MFSDYTVKKAVPKLLIAVILVNLSWVICQAAISTTNILGDGIADLITTVAIPKATPADFPTFSNMSNGAAVFTWSALIVGGGAAGIALFTGGVFAALGAIIAALAALLLGFIVLMFRQFFIAVLVMISPLALVCWAIPGMEKWAKRWWDLFFKLLLMFPFVMAMFGISDVLAVVLRPSADNFISQLMLVFVRFAPFALMPLVFKIAGGAFSTITGMVNDRGKGVFDRGKNWSKERAGNTKRAQIRDMEKQDKINQRKTEGIRMVTSGKRNWNGRQYKNQFTPRGLAALQSADRKERSETALFGLEESMRTGQARAPSGKKMPTGSKSQQNEYLYQVARDHEDKDVRKAARVALAQRGATDELYALQENSVSLGASGIQEHNEFVSENLDLVKSKSAGLAHTLSSSTTVATLPAANANAIVGTKEEVMASQSRSSWGHLAAASPERAAEIFDSVASNPDLRGSLDPQASIGIAGSANLTGLTDAQILSLSGALDTASRTVDPSNNEAVARLTAATTNIAGERAARGI